MSVVALPKQRIKAPEFLLWADQQPDRNDQQANDQQADGKVSVPGIRHHLVVLPDKRAVVHPMRNDEGGRFASVGRDADNVLDPPGITFLVGSSFDDEEAGQ